MITSSRRRLNGRSKDTTVVPEASYSTAKSLVQLIAEKARSNWEALAIATGTESLSYGELEARASNVARRLRSFGVGKDSLVAICLPRSESLIVGALGVMKTGAAYLPLDPSYPFERLAWTLSDAKPAVLLTRERIAGQIHSGLVPHVFCPEEHHENGSSLPFDMSCEAIGAAEDLAYVMYTSGSTGRPKGVLVEHRALMNLVCWHCQAFNVQASDRASHLASPGFDAAVWEIWPYLASGASIHVPTDSVRADPEALRNWMVSQRITIGFVPTQVAERMIDLKWPRQAALRVLLTGADVLHKYPPRGLPFTLVNNYGPTECTVVATSGPVPPNGSGELPSIGKPISNVRIHIVDEKLRPVAAGKPGEICIAGPSVARGYLNAPELTKARFIPNPFGPESGTMYRTGDLAAYLPDGQIAFLGRIDEQIKIRGYRIEPNEVIQALNQHPMVERSLVIARQDAPGDKRLVGYVVTKPGTLPTDRSLREFLGSKVPAYMVPEAFVKLDALPVTASGKNDRNLLPKPNEANAFPDESYVAPRTQTERRIAQVLAGLLGVTRVGVEDNFFLLGGHSLLGTQLIARIRQDFGVDMTLRTIFDSPTVAELGHEVERLIYLRVDAMSDEEAERLLHAKVGLGNGE